MMKIASQLAVMIVITSSILLGCKKVETVVPIASNSNINENPPIVIETSGTTTGINSPTRQLIASNMVYSDDGLRAMEVKIWANYADGQRNYVEVPVDPDYVLFGGGARVTNLSNTDIGVNALLTASYPKNDNTFSTYVAESKDHQIYYYHRLWSYAIGVKMYNYVFKIGYVDALPVDYLKSQMVMYTAISTSPSNRPYAYVSLPYGTSLRALCSGAKLTWPSNQSGLLLTYIGANAHPGGPQFGSGLGKDHAVTTTGYMEAYCLGFNNADPSRGGNPFFEMLQTITDTSGNQHVLTLQKVVEPGYILTGLSGLSISGGFGRPLYALYPLNSFVGKISSKDHVSPDLSGGMDLVLLQMKPSNY